MRIFELFKIGLGVGFVYDHSTPSYFLGSPSSFETYALIEFTTIVVGAMLVVWGLCNLSGIFKGLINVKVVNNNISSALEKQISLCCTEGKKR